MHENSRLIFQRHAIWLFAPGMRVLEVGPDGFPSTYRKMVTHNLDWHSVDIEAHDGLTYLATGEYSFPIPDNEYDIVLSGQVMEHVRKPWRWLPELARVTKPGGLVITVSPVSWHYHEAPVDCWRAYPEGMKALYEDAGLETILATWDSYESPGYKRYIPGISAEWQGRRRRIMWRVLSTIGAPVERSYDAITIGRKPI